MPSDLPRTRDDVVFRRLADDFAILDPAEQQVHVLNPTAAAVWVLCDGSRDMDAIAVAVAEAFGVADAPRVREDVHTAVVGFAERRLLA